MNLRTVTMVSGVVGGVCWLVRLVLDLAGTDETFVDILQWAGLVLIGIALAGLGASLVGKSEPWLRAIVAVALPLLVWSVLEVLHPAGSPAVVDGVFGVVMLAICGRRMLQHREREPSRAHGTHSR